MTVKLSPIYQDPQFDNNGLLLAGGLLYWYTAGTTTPLNTYTDSTGATAQANPIVLNSRGQPDNPIWLTSGSTYKAVLKTSAGVTLQSIDNVSGINDVATAAVSEWALWGSAATYISGTSFSVPGDATATLSQYRRLKATITGGAWYGTIVSATYALGITTFVVVNDTISLDSGLSQLYYSILSGLNYSIPAALFVASKSIASNGFIELGPQFGNLILNYGTTTTNGIGLSAVTWSKAFTMACYAVIPGSINTGSVVATYQAASTTGATFQTWTSSTGAALAGMGVSYLAIGK